MIDITMEHILDAMCYILSMISGYCKKAEPAFYFSNVIDLSEIVAAKMSKGKRKVKTGRSLIKQEGL